MKKTYLFSICVFMIILISIIPSFFTNASNNFDKFDINNSFSNTTANTPTPPISLSNNEINNSENPINFIKLNKSSIPPDKENLRKLQILENNTSNQIKDTNTHDNNKTQFITIAGQGIYGKVTQNGSPAQYVNLELRFYDGYSWSTKKTTYTDSNGDFSFTNIPSLSQGQEYYVRYLNYNHDPSRVVLWGTNPLLEYQIDTNIHIGDFDIAGIPLKSPSNNATISLPYIFQWTKRSPTSTDVYEFNLFDPSDTNNWWWVVVGDSDNHKLYCLPNNFSTGKLYGWELFLYNNDGYGISFYREITISKNSTCNGIRGIVKREGSNQSNLPLQLWLSLGNSYFVSSETTSNTNGVYKFVNLPSLPLNAKYWVKYSNDNLIDGNLWLWMTKEISSYTANTDLDMGSFDIQDIYLDSPLIGSYDLPIIFKWWMRSSVPSDTYYIEIWNDQKDMFFNVGHSNTFSLSCMIPGLVKDDQYYWTSWAGSPDGGYGRALYYRWFTITNGPECYKVFLPVSLK